jgi:hypothetical protein
LLHLFIAKLNNSLSIQLLNSYHPRSLYRIAELEAPRNRAGEEPEEPPQAPQIVKHLQPKFENVHESQTLHIEAQILPVNDNTLKVIVSFSLLI